MGWKKEKRVCISGRKKVWVIKKIPWKGKIDSAGWEIKFPLPPRFSSMGQMYSDRVPKNITHFLPHRLCCLLHGRDLLQRWAWSCDGDPVAFYWRRDFAALVAIRGSCTAKLDSAFASDKGFQSNHFVYKWPVIVSFPSWREPGDTKTFPLNNSVLFLERTLLTQSRHSKLATVFQVNPSVL